MARPAKMKKSKSGYSFKNKADYNARWETIYADKDIPEKDLEEFKKQLKEKDLRILHVIMGEK